MAEKFAIFCKSCKKILNGEDDIFGTSCGHLYHFSCIREFHGKSAQCLHCCSYKPIMFKMFMEFGKVQSIPWQDQEKKVEIVHQLEETKKANAFLKKAFKVSQENIKKLEENIKALKDALQVKEQNVHELEDRIDTLEQLSKYLSSNNNCSNAEAKNHGAIPKKSNHNTQYKWIQNEPNHTKKCSQQQSDEKYRNGDEKDDIANNEQFEEKTIEFEKIWDDMPSNTVMIKNFRKIDLKDEPFENIICLAKQMSLRLNRAQINELFIFSERPNYYTIVVEFNDKNLKDEFIKKKNILRHHPKTRYLEVV